VYRNEVIDILRLPPKKKGCANNPSRLKNKSLNTFNMSTKLISSETLNKLSKRAFNTEETLMLLMTPLEVFWSWGVALMFGYNDKALALHVSGYKFKGWVVVVLNWDDTYEYYLLNPDESIKLHAIDIYFNELQYRIDCDVETLEDPSLN
jgi:hypothetical protein